VQHVEPTTPYVRKVPPRDPAERIAYYRERHPDVPVVPDLDRKILSEKFSAPPYLQASTHSLLKGLLDNVLSDLLWARAVTLTSPAFAAVGLALTLPPAVAFWSARLGVKPGNFDVSLFVNNILDKSTWTRRERASNPFEFFRRETLRPRTFGVTASYRY
jgi:hypothetical protein